jgi:DNA-directed RNA polymerase specialized sigma24 family protein
MGRRLNKRQQKLAEECLIFIRPTIATFWKRNSDLRPAMKRVDMESVAQVAVCMAAFTYNKTKSKPTTYFSSAIRHALYRAVLNQQKQDGRYICTEQILDPQPSALRTRQELRAMRALRLMTVYDRALLEDRLIEQITLEQLSNEQRCDPRTISKRVRAAIDRLRGIEGNLP